MAESLKLENFAATATDYATDNKLHLHSQLLAPGMDGIAGSPIKPLGSFVQPIPTKDRVLLTDFKVGNVLQPDNRSGFTPTIDVVTFKPRWAQVVEAKINLAFTEKQLVALQKSYLAMLATPASAKLILDKFPVFEAMVISKVMEKAKSEIRSTAIWKGVRNVNSQTPQAIFNGWLKIIDDLVIAGVIVPGQVAAINAITDQNAVAEFKKIVRLLPSQYLYSDQLILLVAPEHLAAYEANYQTTRGPLVYNNSFNQVFVEGTLIEICVEPGLAGHETPILTTKQNLAFLYDDDFDAMTFKFDYQVRTEDIAMIMKFQAQPEIIDPTEIWFGNVA
jgi:hypothetical protein